MIVCIRENDAKDTLKIHFWTANPTYLNVEVSCQYDYILIFDLQNN